MRNRQRWTVVYALFLLLIPLGTTLASPPPLQIETTFLPPTESPLTGSPTPELASDEPRSPRIILVMDISGSMETHVLPDFEELPEDVQELVSQLEEIDNGAEIVDIDTKTKAIEKSDEVIASNEAINKSYIKVEEFFRDQGFKSIQSFASQFGLELAQDSCDPQVALAMVISRTWEELEPYFSTICPLGASDELKEKIHERLSYLDDPDYQTLISTYYDALQAQDDLFTNLGYYDLLNQRENLLQSKGYYNILDKIEARAEELGYPTRLDLAKVASATLIDLSKLDDISGSTDSRIGLVQFSDDPYLIMPLSDQFDSLKTVIETLQSQGGTNIGGGLQLALDEIGEADPNHPALIILMSDGNPTRGMTSDQILALLAPRAADAGIQICTAGFASKEDEIDAELMNALADQTKGKYAFAKTGEELLNFFVSCRQGLLSNIVSQLQGNVLAGEVKDAGTVDVPEDTAGVKLTLNYLDGELEMVLTDPQGQEVTEEYPGYQTQKEANVQLSTLKDPTPGEWHLTIKSITAPQKGSIYNILVSMTERQITPTPVPSATPTPSPGFLSGGALPAAIGGCLCLGLLLLAIAGAVVFILRRRGNAPPPTPTPVATPPAQPPEAPSTEPGFDAGATLVSQSKRSEASDTSDLSATIVHRPQKEEESDDSTSAV